MFNISEPKLSLKRLFQELNDFIYDLERSIDLKLIAMNFNSISAFT